jgi:hypothetical protein
VPIRAHKLTIVLRQGFATERAAQQMNGQEMNGQGGRRHGQRVTGIKARTILAFDAAGNYENNPAQAVSFTRPIAPDQ